MSEERDRLRSLAGRLARLARRAGTNPAGAKPGDETTESKATRGQSTNPKRDRSGAG